MRYQAEGKEEMTTQAEKAFEEWAESKGIKPNGNAQKMTYKLMKVAWSAAWQQATEEAARIADDYSCWPPKRKFVFKDNALTGSSFGCIDTAQSAADQIAAAIRQLKGEEAK